MANLSLPQFVRWLKVQSRLGTPETDYTALGHSEGSLEAEYRRVVLDQLAKWGVDERHVSVQITQTGTYSGRPVLQAVVWLVEWDRTSALRVLIGLPLLEKRIKKTVASLWLTDVSILDGVMVRASEKLQARDASSELRTALLTLTAGEKTRAISSAKEQRPSE